MYSIHVTLVNGTTVMFHAADFHVGVDSVIFEPPAAQDEARGLIYANPDEVAAIVYQQIEDEPEGHEPVATEIDFDRQKPSKPVPQGPKQKAA